ncbi:11418_t:CDS:2, partial [Diversispora eburnea]
ELKGGSKKVLEWYRIGIQKCNKIWKSENPYSYANSIEDVNLPNWYINNSKFEKVNISPELTSQIDIPKKPNIVNPDPIEVKRMRKQGEMEQIAKNIFRSELNSFDLENELRCGKIEELVRLNENESGHSNSRSCQNKSKKCGVKYSTDSNTDTSNTSTSYSPNSGSEGV